MPLSVKEVGITLLKTYRLAGVPSRGGIESNHATLAYAAWGAAAAASMNINKLRLLEARLMPTGDRQFKSSIPRVSSTIAQCLSARAFETGGDPIRMACSNGLRVAETASCGLQPF
jgi:hypothetical protein